MNEAATKTCPCCGGAAVVFGPEAVIDDEAGRVELLTEDECPRCDGTGEVEVLDVLADMRAEWARLAAEDEPETCPF